ncbi:MAG TPA: tRNA (adenosine(37)-N6)-dimethylallyltransferase MiaA [Bacteriovoracaceae bacterium]|nr:tRNA (adenosine(37)-N6)-dimethylallyltransferase MiaA [Bacteriovoracaceae bacterium]
MKVVVISGPTASGKTQTSIELAARFGGEIVNFDSLLLYKEITIGTAKPSLKERQSIPHHMLDVSSISTPMNASEYAKMALPVVNELLRQKKIVFLVGGSGFYLQALLKGMYDSPSTPPEITIRSETLYEAEGIAPFLEILKQNDPGSFHRYHENDHYRVRRAVEHWWTNGTLLSGVRIEKEKSNEKLSSSNVHGWDLLNLYLDVPKLEHLQIIQSRTKQMLQNGLLEEVKGLIESGFSGNEKPLQSIGYKEIIEFINGNFSSLKDCEERIVVSTRQLAKSQRTWFNRDKTKHCFHPLLQKDLIRTKVHDFLH